MNYLYTKDKDSFEFFCKYLKNKTAANISTKDNRLVLFITHTAD